MRALIFILSLIVFSIYAQKQQLIVGTYTKGTSEGFYVYSINLKSGKSKLIGNAPCSNPSFLTISNDQQYVYVVEEEFDLPQLASYKLQNGQLALINKQSTNGAHPCYVSVDRANKWIFVGNYTGGNLSAFKVVPSGVLEKASQIIEHQGKSINPDRQEKPHIHGTFLSPNEQYLLVTDLGIDQIVTYKFDRSSNKPLTKVDSAVVKAGSGPRHLVFHPDGKLVYIVLELTAEIEVFDFYQGKLTSKQKISLLPPGFKGKFSAADIHLSSDGKFLYATNRGEANTISTYKIAPSTGLLKEIDMQSTGGLIPRNFVIDPTGKYLLVANQESNEIVIFKRNRKTGILTKTNNKISIGHPVCLVFSSP